MYLVNLFVLFLLLRLALNVLYPSHHNLWELGPGLSMSLHWLLIYHSEQRLPFGPLKETMSCAADEAFHRPFLWPLALVLSRCPLFHLPLDA